MKKLFQEKCPVCDKTLKSYHKGFLNIKVIKSCQDGHFEKVFHPALETYIETRKIS